MGVKLESMSMKENRTFYAGSQIIMTGYAGLSGTVEMIRDAREELQKRFSRAFLKQTEDYDCSITQNQIEEICRGEGILLRPISCGGVLSALWEILEEVQCGALVQLRSIPIKQETVEICEYCDVNPYYLRSEGAYLLICKGTALVDRLTEHDVDCCIIGRTTDSNDRILLNDGRQRFLDRPARDEYEIWRKKCQS